MCGPPAFITLYPNPATGTVSIENTGTQVFTQLEIINPEGMTLKKETVTGALTTTDVSAFPPGMYFVRLTNDAAFTVMKLVKE
ncbi:T9SS type A sorting domain-containing protein [Cytophaga hutchinsonii]|uniref:T9SS type A sorting domain-containing protein n=1 Tax=Cytophaga hutchinsonii TaxID=985 RepID=UPI0009D6BF7E|nr:T9SS type A sorting domain-containing protein [Cytophaga hutchinsonii]